MPKVIEAFQDAEPGSHEFKMRLIELVVISIHQIAVLLYKSEPKCHQGDIDYVTSWKKESGWKWYAGRWKIWLDFPEPQPTLFFHISYLRHQRYPDGVADIAGYWAEDQIFGGVVVFDRGLYGREARNVYFHSARKRVTARVWRLHDDQLDQFVDFLLATPSLLASPFPLLPTDENLYRHDSWDAIALHHIYRDIWERPVKQKRPDNGRDVVAVGDYPEFNKKPRDKGEGKGKPNFIDTF